MAQNMIRVSGGFSPIKTARFTFLYLQPFPVLSSEAQAGGGRGHGEETKIHRRHDQLVTRPSQRSG